MIVKFGQYGIHGVLPLGGGDDGGWVEGTAAGSWVSSSSSSSSPSVCSFVSSPSDTVCVFAMVGGTFFAGGVERGEALFSARLAPSAAC